MTHIRIINVPRGSASFSIRKQWLGIKLQLIADSQSGSGTKISNMAKRNDNEVTEEYVVDAKDAISTLDLFSSQAANWWRQHLPAAHRNRIVFAKSDCELVKA